MSLQHTTIDTPLGPLTLVASDRGLRSARWEDDDGRDRARTGGASPVLVAAAEQLREYFAGSRRDFDLPIDEVGTDFQRAAWRVLRSIPYGETRSYGEQALRLGDARRARAVGGANARNPLSIVTPCHRVIGADGSLTGFAAGTDRKRWLLDHEAGVLRLQPTGRVSSTVRRASSSSPTLNGSSESTTVPHAASVISS